MLQIRYTPYILFVALVVISSGCNPQPTKVIVQDKDGTISSISQPGVPSLKGEYAMNVVCDTNSELRIKKVTVTDSKTIFNLVFKSATTSWIRTAAPGQQTAFYIADPDSRAEYKLLNVEGIAVEPAQTPLQEGESVAFKLTFERIPDSLSTFHLIEGKTNSLGQDGMPTRSWTFMNVKLR